MTSCSDNVQREQAGVKEKRSRVTLDLKMFKHLWNSLTPVWDIFKGEKGQGESLLEPFQTGVGFPLDLKG